jgi:hypothetical protein
MTKLPRTKAAKPRTRKRLASSETIAGERIRDNPRRLRRVARGSEGENSRCAATRCACGQP